MDQLILNEPYLSAKYCGTVFDNINSKKNIVYVRFYAEKSAIQDSSFSATFTAMRDKDDEKEACKEVFLSIIKHIDCMLMNNVIRLKYIIPYNIFSF